MMFSSVLQTIVTMVLGTSALATGLGTTPTDNVDIIVGVRGPQVTTPQTIYQTDYQAEVQRAEQRLLDILPTSAVTVSYRYRFSALLALHVTPAALQTISHYPDVILLQPDTVAAVALTDSVPHIHGNEAWDFGYSGAGQTIAILDTGFDTNHPFLTGKFVAEACFSGHVAGSTSLCPNGAQQQTGPGSAVNCTFNSDCEHGTHVAGIAAGQGADFSGVAKDADLIGIQVFSRVDNAATCGNAGTPCLLTTASDYIAGLEEVEMLAASYTIASVNMSFGGGNFVGACDGEAAATPVTQLRNLGIAVVAASGNDGFTNAIISPACITNVIAVGNTENDDTVHSSSNSGSMLDLLAPGTDIYSSVPGGGYEHKTGTSMASPHVAGAIAVLRSQNPSATIDSMLEKLQTTGKVVTDAKAPSSIRSRLDVGAAVLPNCTIPVAGTITVSSNCVIGRSTLLPYDERTVTIPGNFTIQNNARVIIANDVIGNLDFANYYLKIMSGASLAIRETGQIQ